MANPLPMIRNSNQAHARSQGHRACACANPGSVHTVGAWDPITASLPASATNGYGQYGGESGTSVDAQAWRYFLFFGTLTLIGPPNFVKSMTLSPVIVPTFADDAENVASMRTGVPSFVTQISNVS